MVIVRLTVLILNAILLVVGVSYVLGVGNWKNFLENRPFDVFLMFLFLTLPILNSVLVMLQAKEIDGFNQDLERARSRRLLEDMRDPFPRHGTTQGARQDAGPDISQDPDAGSAEPR